MFLFFFLLDSSERKRRKYNSDFFHFQEVHVAALSEVRTAPDLQEIIKTTTAPRVSPRGWDCFRMWFLQKDRWADAVRRSRSILETESRFPSLLSYFPSATAVAGGCWRMARPGTSPRTRPDYSQCDKEPAADKRPFLLLFFFSFPLQRAAEPSPLGISMMSHVSGQQVGRRHLPESHNASQPPAPSSSSCSSSPSSTTSIHPEPR